MATTLRMCMLLIGLAVLAAGCGGSENGTPSQVTGRIVAIKGPDAIESFTLDTPGERYTIEIDEDVDYGFDLAHLRVHQATGQPVKCRLRQRGKRLYALTIDDAPPTGQSP